MWYVNKEKIYRVICSHEKGSQKYSLASTPAVLADKLKNNVPGIESITRITSNFRGDVVINNNNIPVQGFYVDPEFLTMFSFELLEGNISEALRKPNSIILTQTSAKKFFGNNAALGKVIEVANKGSYAVTGILKDQHAILISILSH